MGGPEAIDPTKRRFRPAAYFRCAWANHLDGTGCSTALSLQQQATRSLSQAAERLLHEDAHSYGVDHRVAPVTNGNQVPLAVFSVLAAKLQVVYFNRRHRSTELASPPVALQDRAAKPLVRLWSSLFRSGLGCSRFKPPSQPGDYCRMEDGGPAHPGAARVRHNTRGVRRSDRNQPDLCF
jgi:hypothetical protein